jgi:glycosyltransferase involved in cell wall biosynthesis
LTKKIKILTISDHPLSPSGVGTQTRYVIESLLKTGRFEVISLGGAISHNDYTPVIVEGWEDNWKIFPVDAYGDQNLIRSVLRQHRPDILYFMTDPRFYDWLWQMEDEIRESVPMVYYHVWDNYPYPTYNKVWYDSTDVVATISKVTSDIVQTVSPSVEEHYIPHAVNSEIFKKLDDPVSLQHMKDMRKQIGAEDKVIFFWNNRNARRKQSGSLIFWFKKFLDKVGHDKACLMMHTDINDPHGQPLHVVAEHLGLSEGQIVFSTQKVSPQHLSLMYNASDVTVNISDAEGFGLGTLESLSCQTPIVVTMTGGLQEQVTDGENYFGVGIEPSSKAIIGSLNVPWIYEDRINEDEFVAALEKMFHMSPQERASLGKQGSLHVQKNYNFEDFGNKWVNLMTNIYEKNGSWETRKNYNSWEVKTL